MMWPVICSAARDVARIMRCCPGCGQDHALLPVMWPVICSAAWDVARIMLCSPGCGQDHSLQPEMWPGFCSVAQDVASIMLCSPGCGHEQALKPRVGPKQPRSGNKNMLLGPEYCSRRRRCPDCSLQLRYPGMSLVVCSDGIDIETKTKRSFDPRFFLYRNKTKELVPKKFRSKRNESNVPTFL